MEINIETKQKQEEKEVRCPHCNGKKLTPLGERDLSICEECLNCC